MLCRAPAAVAAKGGARTALAAALARHGPFSRRGHPARAWRHMGALTESKLNNNTLDGAIKTANKETDFSEGRPLSTIDDVYIVREVWQAEHAVEILRANAAADSLAVHAWDTVRPLRGTLSVFL